MYNYRDFNVSGSLRSDNAYVTTYLTKTNEGAITRYPYQINQAIKMAENSYSNYATIDYTTTQKLVGWYSLSDPKSPVVRDVVSDAAADTGELYHGLYSSSPNDVKNNYYLFSNAGCFYSGIQLALADRPSNDAEIKLFINTIIAAHQATNRVIAMPPVINFTKPKPVTQADLSKLITILPADIVDSAFKLTFEITESSTDMDLLITLNGLNPPESWNENIVKVVAGVETPISINNTSKVITTGKYIVKIPLDKLAGDPKLKVTATNAQGKSATAEVTLKMVQKPIVTVEDSPDYDVIRSATTQCIYVDIDFNAIDSTDLNASDKLRVVFNIEYPLPSAEFQVGIISDGVSLTNGASGNVYIRSIDIVGNESAVNVDLTHTTPKGSYAMYLPLTLMQGHSSRDIKITADTSGNVGETTVTLLRRSLFPLD